mmetsp:Transcript_8118/g.29654  ORF Transcript_8118/g.29654 Transcript_8118/m.29654 type:complete len:95 (+) Transcript_8118:2737-3021(+)
MNAVCSRETRDEQPKIAATARERLRFADAPSDRAPRKTAERSATREARVAAREDLGRATRDRVVPPQRVTGELPSAGAGFLLSTRHPNPSKSSD